MNTLTKKKSPRKNKESQQRQSKKHQKQTSSNLAQPVANLQPQEEGLYELVKQDEQLRAYHIAKLRSTDGYTHLSEDAAADMVEQMLRLSTLMFELLLEEGANSGLIPSTGIDEARQTINKPIANVKNCASNK